MFSVVMAGIPCRWPEKDTIAVYSSTAKKAYKLGDPRLYLVAEKR